MAAKGEKSSAKRMAAHMRSAGIERTTGRCEGCKRIITIESCKSRYTHKCSG